MQYIPRLRYIILSATQLSSTTFPAFPLQMIIVMFAKTMGMRASTRYFRYLVYYSAGFKSFFGGIFFAPLLSFLVLFLKAARIQGKLFNLTYSRRLIIFFTEIKIRQVVYYLFGLKSAMYLPTYVKFKSTICLSFIRQQFLENVKIASPRDHIMRGSAFLDGPPPCMPLSVYITPSDKHLHIRFW